MSMLSTWRIEIIQHKSFLMRALILLAVTGSLLFLSHDTDAQSVGGDSPATNIGIVSSELSLESRHSIPIEQEWYRLGLGKGLAEVYEKESGFARTGYVQMLYQDFATETNIHTPSDR